MSAFYKCTNCNKKYKTSDKWVDHVKTHDVDPTHININDFLINVENSKNSSNVTETNKDRKKRLLLEEEERKMLLEEQKNKILFERKQQEIELEKEKQKIIDSLIEKNEILLKSGKKVLEMTADVEKTLCAICLDRERNCIMMNCKHVFCCYECALLLKKSNQRCSICRKDITQIEKIYM